MWRRNKIFQMNYDVAIVISDLGAGGAQKVLTTLLNVWAASKRVIVITLDEDSNDFYSLPDEVDRLVIGGIKRSSSILLGLLSNLKRIFLLRKQLKKIKVPVIMSFICQTNILTIIASLGLSSRVVISERNDPSRQSFGKIWDQLRKRLYRFSDRVTANTHGALQSMKHYVPLHKLHYLPNPIVLATVSEEVFFENPTILTVGRLHKQKAQDILLRAFSQFIETYPNWQLVIIGDGPLNDSLYQLSDQLNLTARVKWYKSVKNITAFYKAAVMFVLPSRHEGTPNALLEAMSHELPVIVSNASSGPLEYVDHEKTGLVVPVEDVASLSAAMLRFAEGEAFRKELAKNAFLRVKKNNLEWVLNEWELILIDNR